MYSWGSNSNGQLGLGTSVKIEKKPVLVKSLKGIPIAFIACGGNHSFAVSRSGKFKNLTKHTLTIVPIKPLSTEILSVWKFYVCCLELN